MKKNFIMYICLILSMIGGGLTGKSQCHLKMPDHFLPLQHQDSATSSRATYLDTVGWAVHNTVLPDSQAISITIVVDGAATDAQQVIARRYIDSCVKIFKTVPVLIKYAPFINIAYINKKSPQTGVSYGIAGLPKVTRYGTHFRHLTVDRALGCDSLTRLKQEVLTQFPETDITLVLAYDGKYGGLAVVDTTTPFRYISAGIDLQTGWSLTDETAVHEFMHWLGLSDEYLDTAACNHFPYIIYGGNITHDTIHHRTWDHWLGAPGISYVLGGICPGNFIGTTYPTMMSQTWGNPVWGPITSEIISSKISGKIKPLCDASTTISFHQWLKVKKVDTQNKLKTFWVVNGDTLLHDIDSLFFNPIDTTKAYVIDFFTVDTNNMVKNTSMYPLGFWHKQWRIGSASLPVTLMSFTAAPKSNMIQLQWSTALEVNNKGFHLERSEDAISFQEIGWVDGFGTTTITQNYIFNDYNIVPRVPYYYRLQQEDMDGHKTPSYIVSSMISSVINPEPVIISIFPNPAHDEMFLMVDSPVWITIINSLGISNIENKYVDDRKVDISSLSLGVYMVMVRRGTSMIKLRFVKE